MAWSVSRGAMSRGAMSRGAMSKAWWASGLFAPVQCRPVGRRDLEVRCDREARRARDPLHCGLPPDDALHSAPRLRAVSSAVWFAVVRWENVSELALSQPGAERSLIETAAARRLEALVASGQPEASRLSARLAALYGKAVPPALAVRPPAESHAEKTARGAAPHETEEKGVRARREGLDDSGRSSEAGLSAVPLPVRRARKPARVGPARTARATALSSAT
ncbi:hypothetical protein [Nitrobacter sp.]|uniref:hypothetical protein n=1 Tax=Nitrobacter sp. TaxID=29420 RepID=UPI00399D6920